MEENDTENKESKLTTFTLKDFSNKINNKRDEFLIAGLLGDESCLNDIQMIEKEKTDAVNNEEKNYNEISNNKKGNVRKYENELSNENVKLEALKKEKDDIQVKVRMIKDKLTQLNSTFHSLFKTLIGKRKKYGDQLLKKKISTRNELNSELSEILINEEKKKLEYEEKLYNISEQRYKKNEKEYNRRISLFEKKRSSVEEKFNQFDDYITILRSLGINRTSSGFLIWSGYLGMIAFGWYIGEMIINKVEPNNSFITQLAKAINELFTEMWTGILFVVILPVIIIFIYILLLHFTRRLRFKDTPSYEKGIAEENV